MTSRFFRNKKLVALNKKQCLNNGFAFEVEIHNVRRADIMIDTGEVLLCFTDELSTYDINKTRYNSGCLNLRGCAVC